ncbi:MAG: ABC transporter substrate-binding protein [Gemmatimonadaceae bacterium]|jgi:peptide/nickel transport system substrate-binding protein/oligopeptide transport system substrate-binding protein|nr:ABC transporter substrate-binding protein [Gemmatimonadaceae bacterium]
MPRPFRSIVRRLATRAALVAPLAVTIACAGADASPKRGALVDSRDTYDPRSLDPARSTDVPTGRAVSYLFEGLTRFAPDARIEPALALDWSTSADGRTWSFRLRPNVRFHDGQPFTARTVVASWQRVLDPATKGGRGWPLYPILGARAFADGRARTIAGLRTIGDSVLQVTLEEPLAIFPKLLAMPVTAIVPEKLPPDFAEHPVGTGPWRFVEWKHDDYLRFVKNTTYWGDAPQVDTLVARIIPEPSTAVAEFEAGNVDLLYIPDAETRQWQETDERKALLQSAPALRLFYVAINTQKGPLADVRVRRALSHAVDAAALQKQLLGGRGRPAAGVIPPSLDGADTARRPYRFDPAESKRLLAEAGHPNGITLELWHSQETTIARLAQALQGYLQQGGITVTLVQRESASLREAARKGEADLVLKDWYADYPDAENFLFPLLHSSNAGVGGNVSFFKDRQYDSLVTAARGERDDAIRTALYRRADQLAFDQAPMLFLFFYSEVYAVQPWVKNWMAPTVFNGQRMTAVSIDRTQR